MQAGWAELAAVHRCIWRRSEAVQTPKVAPILPIQAARKGFRRSVSIHPAAEGPVSQGSVADVELVRCLAVLAKASFAYQHHSRRVVDALATFQAGLREWMQPSGQPFVLEIRPDGAHAPSGRIPPSPVTDWLREMLQRSLVGALHFDAALTDGALLQFLDRLRTTGFGKQRKEAAFASNWPDTYEGLRLRELKFAGGFHALDVGSDPTGLTLLETLAGESEQRRSALVRLGLSAESMHRILTIERRIGGPATRETATEWLSLPDELLAALPADVLDDSKAREQFAERMLDELEKALDAADGAGPAAEATAADPLQLFRRVARTLFVSQARRAQVPVDGAAPAALPHRPEDGANALEGAAELVALFEALPSQEIALMPAAAALQTELAGICLFHLSADGDAFATGPAAAKLREVLDQGPTAGANILEQYVLHEFDPGSSNLPDAAVESVFRKLGQFQLLPALRSHGGLSSERVIRHFPNGFVLFLKALAPNAAADAAALKSVLGGLDETALAAGSRQLLQSGELLQPVMLRKLLAIGERQSIELVRHLLRGAPAGVYEEIAHWLKQLDLDCAEAVPLALYKPARLPAAYVQLMCDLVSTGRTDPLLDPIAGDLLRNFIATTPNEERTLELKQKAILALWAFPGPASLELLKTQLRGRGLLGSLRVPRPIRDAAVQVMTSWKEQRHV